MYKLRDILQVLLLCVFLAGTLSACSDKELYSAPEDLSGAKVGLLNVELPQDSLYKVMPGAEFKEYGKFMQLFLDLSTGRCDAAVVDSAMAAEATGKNSGYVLIGNVCGYHAIVHESRCEHREQYGITSIGWWKNWKNRLERGLFNDDATALLLKGLYTTVVIFFFAAIFAILLAAILTYMAIKHRWVYI